MNIIFKLRENKGKKPLIYLTGYINSNKFIYSTRERILPELWKNDRPVKRKGNALLAELNSDLDRLESHVQEIERDYRIKGEKLTRETLKRELDLRTGKIKIINKEVFKESIKFVDFAEEYVLDKISRGQYHKSLRTVINIVKKEIDKNILLDDINIVFFKKFLKYMSKENFSKNYTGKMIGNIKQIMNYALEIGATENNKYNISSIKRESEDVYNIYLDDKELNDLYEHDFSKEPFKDNARDLFLIGAYTGMRFQDYSDLEGVNFEGGEFVIRDTQKTGARVIIPQHPIVKKILIKREGKLPHAISNQKFNKYLKDIGKDIELNTPIVKTITRVGKKIKTTLPKHKLLCSHTARRSLATNLYLAGVPVRSIMMLTGHATITQLMSYIKVTEIEQAKALQDHPYFK